MTDLVTYEEVPEVLTGEVMEFELLEKGLAAWSDAWLISYRGKKYVVSKGRHGLETAVFLVNGRYGLIEEEDPVVRIPGDVSHLRAITELEQQSSNYHYQNSAYDFKPGTRWEDIWSQNPDDLVGKVVQFFWET